MSLWSFKEIKSALSDNLVYIADSDIGDINEVIIDSRKNTNNGLFIAIKGDNNDGHNFLSQVFENGASLAIVQNIPQIFQKDPRLILVKDSFKALEQLAHFSRHRFNGKVIAVTGSAGKTSVKEMLNEVLSSQGSTFATMGNLNNHFGLPLTLCNLPQNYDYAILEMGMNHLGEIDKLTQIGNPHIAIISNVFAAHIGNFDNEQQIAQAKSEIFLGVEEGGFAIINNDNKHHDYVRSKALECGIKEENIINFGRKIGSNIRLDKSQLLDSNSSQITVSTSIAKQESTEIKYVINSINEITILNSLIAVALLKLVASDFNLGLQSFQNLKTPKGRGNISQIKLDKGEATLIDDSYNANSASMIAGLKFLSDFKKQHHKKRSIAIIGDMLELGSEEISEHNKIAQYIIEYDIDKVFLVGELMQNLLDKLPKEKIAGSFKNSIESSKIVAQFLENDDVVLIKGSRGMAMERAIRKL
ncbi:MAG: UDP-N-acetylmuramoyl-tripeptide--D-alanyl-D-alanine ligase [Proteobacteria bacterium]|nr:UDP-N-acetylmuramoyl-tripeptide--D-alanyl-D-alanine ligase [Pseudomonadota bacterium]